MKTILIHSGGLDSTVLLFKLLAEGRNVQLLSINYGQRHKRELQYAMAVGVTLGLKQECADLTAITKLLKGSSQTSSDVAVPHGHYAEDSMKLTVVPNRNMIMLAVAGGWAISEKADSIAYAAHAGDHAIYPDCREEFVAPLAQAFQNADWHKVAIERPFIALTKAEIVKLGNELKVPFHMTYSCYEGQELHCGKCGTCTERKEAFALAGVKDPTRYSA